MDSYSIIIPAYNAERTLDECLRRIEAQKGGKQIIVVDDGSTDHTAAIAAEHDVELLSLSRSGPSIARNEGVKRAKGDILLFVDADVYLPEDFLPRVSDLFGGDPGIAAVQALYSDRIFPYDLSSRYKQKMQHWLMHHIAVREFCEVGTFAVAIRREPFAEAGGFDPSINAPLCEDLEFGHRLTRRGGKIIAERSLVVDHDTREGLLDLLIGRFRRAEWYTTWTITTRISDGDSAGILKRVTGNKSYVGWEYVSSALLAPLVPVFSALGLVNPWLLVPAGAAGAAFVAINRPASRHAASGDAPIHPVTFLGLRFLESLVLFAGLTTGTLKGMLGRLR